MQEIKQELRDALMVGVAAIGGRPEDIREIADGYQIFGWGIAFHLTPGERLSGHIQVEQEAHSIDLLDGRSGVRQHTVFVRVLDDGGDVLSEAVMAGLLAGAEYRINCALDAR